MGGGGTNRFKDYLLLTNEGDKTEKKRLKEDRK